MKTSQKQNRKSEQGAMLVGAIIMAAVISTVLVAVVSMVAQEHRMLARSTTWNAALPMAEAGVEEAMSHMRQVGVAQRFVNGWTAVGTNFVMSRTRTDGKYAVSISSASPPIIISTGQVWCASANKFIERRIRAKTKGESFFMSAISAKRNIVLSGTAMVDSFDSVDPAYSTGGTYDPTKKKAKGDVVTNESTPGAISLGGQATIYGKVATGPAGTVAMANPSQVKVGSVAHVDGGGSGIQSGYYTKDMNVSFPDVVEPYTYGYPMGLPSVLLPMIVDGVLYKYVLYDGNYSMETLTLTASEKMLVMGTAQLYVRQNVSIAGSLVVKPGAGLQLYVQKGTISLTGNGVRNETGFAGNFAVWAMPLVTTVGISGEGQFTGTLYAPQAALNLSGGGSSGLDFIGAAVANTVNGSGKYKFHYDEALQNTGLRNLTVVSWKEI